MSDSHTESFGSRVFDRGNPAGTFVQARWHPPTVLQIYDCEPSKVLSLEHESFSPLYFSLFFSLDSLCWVSVSFSESAKLFKHFLNKRFLVPFRQMFFPNFVCSIFNLKKEVPRMYWFQISLSKLAFLSLYSSFFLFVFYRPLQVVHRRSGLSQTLLSEGGFRLNDCLNASGLQSGLRLP